MITTEKHLPGEPTFNDVVRLGITTYFDEVQGEKDLEKWNLEWVERHDGPNCYKFTCYPTPSDVPHMIVTIFTEYPIGLDF